MDKEGGVELLLFGGDTKLKVFNYGEVEPEGRMRRLIEVPTST